MWPLVSTPARSTNTQLNSEPLTGRLVAVLITVLVAKPLAAGHCTLATGTTLYFFVVSGELNRDGAGYLIMYGKKYYDIGKRLLEEA